MYITRLHFYGIVFILNLEMNVQILQLACCMYTGIPITDKVLTTLLTLITEICACKCGNLIKLSFLPHSCLQWICFFLVSHSQNILHHARPLSDEELLPELLISTAPDIELTAGRAKPAATSVLWWLPLGLCESSTHTQFPCPDGWWCAGGTSGEYLHHQDLP